MKPTEPAEVAALDALRDALAGLNKAMSEASKLGIRIDLSTTERAYVSQAAPTIIAQARCTRMRIEIDERF